ncbi:MAG: hypothetical protein RSF77_02895 [Oscillospiraceae bacterium]
MLDTVLTAVVSALTAAGIKAFRQFPNRRADLSLGAFVCLGVDSCKCLSSGLGEYLGIKIGAQGLETELFGRRLELLLGFDVFSPFESAAGADGCIQCADALRGALSGLPSSIRGLELSCGEVSADEESGCFRCKCTLRALAFLVAESSGDGTEFLNYVLKGTVKI